MGLPNNSESLLQQSTQYGDRVVASIPHQKARGRPRGIRGRMADIAVSFAEVLPAQHPAVFGLPIEHVTALLGKPQNSMPVDLDLADPATHAALCSIDLDWPQIAAEQREEWLQNVRVSLPIRQIATGDIALLPGGIITARHPTTCLVCDPQQAVTLDDDAARQVRRVLAGRAGVATLI